jgi:hypothetical protein
MRLPASQVVNANGRGAFGQQSLIGPSFVVVVEQLNPEQDPAVLDRTFKVGRMARNEPMTERHFKRWCPELESPGEAFGDRTGRAADQLATFLKRKLPLLQSLILECRPAGCSQHPVQSEAIQILDLRTTGTQIAQGCVYARPGVEGGDGKARCWTIDHARSQVWDGLPEMGLPCSACPSGALILINESSNMS